jgi:hypothetical protein
VTFEVQSDDIWLSSQQLDVGCGKATVHSEEGTAESWGRPVSLPAHGVDCLLVLYEPCSKGKYPARNRGFLMDFRVSKESRVSRKTGSNRTVGIDLYSASIHSTATRHPIM